jgi:hypothetical protein
MNGDFSGGGGQQPSSGNWAPPPPWAQWGWNNWGAPRRPGPGLDNSLRIGDAERSEVIETISRHYAEGRLDENEMRERVEQATAAKTRGDLAGLLNDLPPLYPQTPQDSGPMPMMRIRSRHRFLTFCLVAVIVISVAGWMTAPWHFPWVLFLILGFLVFRRGGWWHHHHNNGPTTTTF